MIARQSLTAAFLVVSLASLAMGAEKVFPYRYEKAVLANGLTVIMVPLPSPGLASFYTVVRVGSRDEVEPGRSGYAHFFEHMMFRGTKKYPGAAYNDAITSLGARANACTSADYTLYYLTFAKEDLEKVMELESDRFQNLSYDRAAFQTEAGAVYGEYRIKATQPWSVLSEKLQDLAFDAHTYKHTTIGFEADVKAMPEGYDYSLQFYNRFYRPENVVLLITGDIHPAETLSLVEKYYGGWNRGYQPPKIAAEPPQTAPRSAEIEFAGKTLPLLVVAFKGDAFDPNNRDYMAAHVLGQLAFGPQSELYKKLVLREQRVESLDCMVPASRDPSLIRIAAVVKKPEDVDAVRQEIDRTLEDCKQKAVDLRKLDELKRRERYEFLASLDAPATVANRLVGYIVLTGGIEVIEPFFAALNAVTPEDILRAAQKYFVPERRTMVTLKEQDAGGKKTGGGERAAGRERARWQAVLTEVSHSRRRQAAPRRAVVAEEARNALAPVLLPVAEDPTVSFRIWFRVGSQDDPRGKEGLAAITAAMLTEGATRHRTYEQILDKLFPLAAGYASTVGPEMTMISGRVHKDNLDRFYPLLVEAIREPAFRQEDLDRIKAQTLSYLENTLRFNDNEELGKAVLYNTIFAGTPYGHLPKGTIESVRGITLEDVRRFYRSRYTSGNVVIGLGGSYPPALLEKLQRDLAALPCAVPAATEKPRPATIPGRQVTIVEKACNATAISLGFPIAPVRGTREWYALAVANSWLGEHRNQNGRLYQVIREARGLNYGDFSYIEHFPGGSGRHLPPVNAGRRQQIFEIWLRPVPHAAREFALRAALRELQRLVEQGMTQEQFEQSRNFLRKYVLHYAPTTFDRLGYAVDDRFYGIEGAHLEKYRKALDTLTRDEVNAAIRKHLQWKDMAIVFVTQNGQALKESLAADAPSPITYATPKPDSVLAEDREISVYPLHIRRENVRIVPADTLFAR